MKNSGFSLVEAIIYCGITSSLIVSSFVCSEFLLGTLHTAAEKARIESAGIFSIRILEQQISSGTPLALPNLGTDILVGAITTTEQASSSRSLLTVHFLLSGYDFSFSQRK